MENIKLGIDFGGSGIKGGLVDTEKGVLQGDRFRIETPDPSTPEHIAEVINQIVTHFDYQGDIGVAFPAVVQNGVIKTASNIDKSWIGTNAAEVFTHATGQPAKVINDADAAGIAEMAFGHGKDEKGVVILVTIGSGLGTAIFTNGILLPNTELGHIHYKNKVAEKWASDAVRKKENHSWKKWGKRFGEYLSYMEKLFYPDLIILGGGASKKFDKYEAYLENVDTRVVPAYLQNQAGIIGSATSLL
ncbi:MAG: ROK family protein [Bacteroidales bacterium]|nr:ROK family protein [Bacteroidales bacterium]